MSVGKIYGYQWRSWADNVDQLQILLEGLKTNPTSRRHLLTTYDPAVLDDMCLPPCHVLTQFHVTNVGYLDCAVTMRSVDLCLGLPSDVVLYAALTILIAAEVGLRPGTITFMMGNTHVYTNHIATWHDQRIKPICSAPSYSLKQPIAVEAFMPTDISIHDYHHSGKMSYAFNV